MISRKDKSTLSPSTAGFSMIDVLVAIVVLATALLALAALQGALTRNAADARARSQIAAYTEGLIDQMRAAGYGNITAGTITPDCTGSATKQKAEACAAQTVAGVSNLTTTVVSTPYYADLTTGVFGTAVVTGAVAAYDQVNITTSWTDAAGQARQLAFDTVVSPIQVDQNNKTLDTANLLPQIGSTPIVRQFNPGLTAGVIPIAMGSGTDANQTAATNPQPEILGKNNNQFIGGVSYNVLTFAPPETIDGQDNETRITQNIATRVVRCNCKYGAGVTTGVFAQAFRPTYWDASQSKYVSPAKASGTSSDTGVDTDSNFVNGVYSPEQDTNCDVCCRDRNDTGATGEIRFNPWNPSDNSHYRYVNTTDTVPTAVLSTNHTDAYVNACRLIIVDGVFTVATDMQNYFFGLVGTDTAFVQKVPALSTSTNTASSPLPTAAYTVDYQNFVIDYLMQIRGATALSTTTVLTTANYPLNTPSSPTSGNDAANLFATSGLASGGLSVPNNIDINYVDPGKSKTAACIPTGTQDCRYLHPRGLFVDYLEPVTLTAINNAISTCSANTKAALENCVLPLMPFTTINLTQLVDWSELDGTGKDVTVTDTALTGGNPDQPLRGVVSALSTGSNNTTSNAVATTGLTNSAVIGTLTPSGISPTDAATTLSAKQKFTLASGGVGAANTIDFDIVLSGGAMGTGTNTPSVSWLGLSTYYTTGSAASTVPCTSGTSPNVLITYLGSTTNKCTSPQPNLATTTGLPTGSTAGLQVAVQKYNIQNDGVGGTGTNCATKIKGVPTAASGTTCSVYKVNSVAVNGTAVSSWANVLSTGGAGGAAVVGDATHSCYSNYGQNAISTVTVPSGLSSTTAGSPDLLQIGYTQDNANSYTPDAFGNPGGTGFRCTLVGGKYTYTKYSCCN